MENVFHYAARTHQIPWILNADDVMQYPNERSLLVYASFFYNLFCDTPPVHPPVNPRRSMVFLSESQMPPDRGRDKLVRSTGDAKASKIQPKGAAGRGRGVGGGSKEFPSDDMTMRLPGSMTQHAPPRVGPEISIPAEEIVDFSVDIDVTRLKLNLEQEGSSRDALLQKERKRKKEKEILF
jgi:hypothetical protein